MKDIILHSNFEKWKMKVFCDKITFYSMFSCFPIKSIQEKKRKKEMLREQAPILDFFFFFLIGL